MEDKVLIVGDRFYEFARNDGVITISELEDWMESKKSDFKNYVYELGQGLSDNRIKHLLETAEKYNCRDLFKFNNLNKCGIKQVHKRRPENSMLSVPVRITENTYEADLHIDDASELMIDHVSGQHVQGMVLIEAARQAILAITEEFYSEDITGAVSFVWEGINVEYKAYAFPIKTQILLSVDSLKKMRKTRFGMTVTVNFVQNDTVVFTAVSSHEVYEKKVTKVRELKLASLSVT